MARKYLSLLMLAVLIAVIGYSLLIKSNQQSRPLEPIQIERAWEGVPENRAWTPVNRRAKGLDLVLVPAGCFSMGSSDEQLQAAVDSCDRFFGIDGCTLDLATLEQPVLETCIEQPFWIGRTEVTNKQYGSPRYTEKEGHVRDRDWPVEAVSWVEARSFCEDRGMRLPREAEWEYAARGPDNLIYPWGDEFDLHRVTSGMLNPDVAGRHPLGVSWVGALDMSGGVAEWVEDPFIPYGRLAAEVGVDGLPERVARGGSWFSFAPFYLRSAMRETLPSAHASSVVGFRCAAAFELFVE